MDSKNLYQDFEFNFFYNENKWTYFYSITHQSFTILTIVVTIVEVAALNSIKYS